MNVKNKMRLLVSNLLMMLLLVNCTGYSYGRLWGIQGTNPTPEYSDYIGMFTKGGAIYHNHTMPAHIGNAEAKTAGTSCSRAILYLFSFGDSSIEAAKKEGKITKVATVEYEQTGVLGVVYHSFCTTVTGSNDSISGTPETKTVAPEAKQPAKLPAKKGK